MGNIGTFTIEHQEWVKLEDVIKEKIEDFAFEVNKSYVMQNFEPCYVCIDSQIPTATGFMLSPCEKFGYKDASGTTIYVKPMGELCRINIAE